jgi:hypothetical protein
VWPDRLPNFAGTIERNAVDREGAGLAGRPAIGVDQESDAYGMGAGSEVSADEEPFVAWASCTAVTTFGVMTALPSI